MSCTKCNEKFLLSATASNIYFITEFDEMNEKIHNYLNKLSIAYKTIHDIIYIEVENTEEFFIQNISSLNKCFNELEKNVIKLYTQEIGQTLSFQSLLQAKPIQRYINLIEDREFFDIINNESLTSYFQPIINAKNRDIYGYETLIRGVKDDGSLLYPDELFKKSYRNDLDFRVDKLCRETALKTAATKKVKQKVFINFLPTAIYDPEYCLNSTIKWAKQLDFDPSNIVFEVVETQQVKDKEHLLGILKYYREKGYMIALDDVGEGYSGLNMLIDIKPDIIKVDRNIITNIDQNKFKQSVYKALYQLSIENGIKILAEGVETPYELDTIEKIGVDYIQGYYFAKPQAEPIRKIEVFS